MLKLMILPRTRTGMTADQLQHYLRKVHGPLCMAQADVRDHFRRYVHHYAVYGSADPLLARPLLRHDALTVIGFDDMAGFAASKASEGYGTIVGPDEANFSEREGSLFLVAKEFVLADRGRADGLKLFHFRKARAGAEPSRISAEWCGRLATVLAGSDLGALSGYVHNLTVPAGPHPAPFDMIDEIAVGPSGLAALGVALARAEGDLFESSAANALVTRSFTFIP